MNLVIDDAFEVAQDANNNDSGSRKQLGTDPRQFHWYQRMTNLPAGQILLKGDNVSLIQTLKS